MQIYSLYLISSFFSRRLFHISNNRCHTSYLPFYIPFISCGIVSTHKSIEDWAIDSTCFVGVCNLCKLLFPCGKNLQLCLQSTWYNIYVDFDKPTILCHAISQIFISWIMIIFHHFMFLLICNLLEISKPYVLWSSKDKP